MADDLTLPPDPATASDWMSRLTAALSNPLMQGLAGMTQGFGQAAMPTRMPIPWGAALGMGMGGLSQGISNAYKTQLEQAQAQQQMLQTQVQRAQLPLTLAEAQMRAQMFKDPNLFKSIYGSGNASPLSMLPDTTPPAPGGGGYAPSKAAPLTPFVASNLPQGVSAAEDQMVRTVIGEAAGEPLAGQQAVAAVIKNRMRLGNQDAQSVIFSPNQFEPWNNPATRARLEGIDPASPQYQAVLNNAVRPVLGGQVADPTGGATHFFSPTAQAALGREAPAWATGSRTTIGNHAFYYPGYAGNAPGTARSQAPDAPYQVSQAGPGATPPPAAPGGPTAPAVAAATPTAPSPGAAPAPAVAPPVGNAAPVASSQGDAMQLSLRYEAAAQDLERRQKLATYLKLPDPGGDPALLRQKSLEYLQLANAGPKAFAEATARAQVEQQTAPGIAGAKAAAELPAKLAGLGFQLDANGNMAPIKGGMADPAYVGSKAAAEAEAKAKVELATAGPIQQQKSLNENVHMRDYGTLLQTPTGPIFIPTPRLDKTLAPGGGEQPTYVTPPPPGSPPGTPGTATPVVGAGGQPVISQRSPEQSEASKELGVLSGKITAANAAAPTGLQRLDVLENAAATFRPGASAALRLAGAQRMTDALQTLGITPPDWLAKGAAAGETIGKEGGFLAAEMTRALGSREAASVFNQIRNIQPNIELSQGGFQVIVNSIRQGLLRDQHLSTFQDRWLADPAHNGSIRGMTDAFEQQFPVEAYASRVVPYPMPAKAADAKVDVIYNTGKGPARWNGTAFEPLAAR